MSPPPNTGVMPDKPDGFNPRSYKWANETIHSNHVNYLVWRYLQEAGFLMAATWLGREWHREPHKVMPFAKYVNQHQLVRMLQDALFYDDVRARGVRENHRHFFGDDPGPMFAAPEYDIAGLRQAQSRPSVDGGVNGAVGDPSSLISRRRSRPSLRAVNGDTVDTDDNGYGPSEQASETDSPAPTSQDVPMIHTLEIGESRVVSTDKPRDLSASSSFLDWPKDATINHAIWSSMDPEPMLAGGSNMLRLYGVRNNPDLDVQHRDIKIPLESFEIEAVCWTGKRDIAFSLVDTTVANNDRRKGSLMFAPSWGASGVELLNPLAGTVFALRFNPASNLLLSLSGGVTTLISIYKIEGGSAQLLHTRELRDAQLFDAAWMSDDKFIACGTNMLQILQVSDDDIKACQTQEMRKAWFRIKYDAVCDIAALVDEEMHVLRQYNVGTEDTKTQAFTDVTLTAFEFQPIPNRDSYVPGSRRLLATSTVDGTIQLWDVTRPFTCVHRLILDKNFIPEQISFSPDGYLLAAGGWDTVTVWRPEDGGQPKAIWSCTDQSLWRSNPEDMTGKWPQSLMWDPDGKKIVFGLADQAVVIRVL